jgi:hypothetical protein
LSKTAPLLFLLGASVVAQPVVPVTPPSAQVPEEDLKATSAVSASPSAFTNSWLEREPVAGGAELITLFGRLQDPASGASRLDVPLLSVLRDTLGDSDAASDRLRYVWILTSTRPTPRQRLASALSFFRFRAGSKQHANQIPSPVMDLAAPGKKVWSNILGAGLQSTQFDPLGMAVRACTRSYRGNSSDYRKLHLYQALDALALLDRRTDDSAFFPDSDLRKVYSRLSLSDRTLGGLVRENKLSKFYDRETSRRVEAQAHNWELLRQRAESNGLFFEPLALPGASPTEALLWVASDDLKLRQSRHFERQFLNIANPWTDDRLLNWSGYKQVRTVPADAPEARQMEMIPLALYSLDHPRAPLLLADFRDKFKAKRSELVRHGTTTLLTSVFGITRFGNWPLFLGDSAWTFVRGRHGAAVDRSARLRSYSEARAFVSLDTSLDLGLKTELLRRLDQLALNPLENGISVEATVAKEQYAALLRHANSPAGLTSKLDHDRRRELQAYKQSRGKRILAVIGRAIGGGSRQDSPNLLAELASYRRVAHHERFLQQLLASSPRPEVAWNAAAIRESVDALASEPLAGPRAWSLIAQIFSRSGDSGLRHACLQSLQRLKTEEARNELWRLSQDPNTGDEWRAICLLYYRGESMQGSGGEPANDQ